jgi:hypothetical protein
MKAPAFLNHLLSRAFYLNLNTTGFIYIPSTMLPNLSIPGAHFQ